MVESSRFMWCVRVLKMHNMHLTPSNQNKKITANANRVSKKAQITRVMFL